MQCRFSILKLYIIPEKPKAWGIFETVAGCLLAVLVLFSLLQPAIAVAERFDPKAELDLAHQLYADGNYAQAAQAYRRLIEAGFDNGHLRYNLANAMYRIESYGEAIANYRRAKAFLPRNQDIAHNLELARRHSLDKLDPSNNGVNDVISQILKFPFTLFGERGLWFIFLAGYTVICIALALFPVVKWYALRPVFIAALMTTMLSSGFLYLTIEDRKGGRRLALTSELRNSHPAVVVSKVALAHSGDSTNFQAVFRLHEGAEILLFKRRNNWAQAILPDGRRGWIEEENLEIL